MLRRDFVGLIDQRGYKVAAEIGVAWGAFSTELLASRLDTLYCIDNWAQRARPRGRRQPWGTSANMRKAIQALKPFGQRAKLWRQESGAAAEALQHRGIQLDFVYIDADHSYEAVRRDLELWWPLVRQGGILAGHDYDKADMRGCGGVIRAVDHFVDANKLVLYTTDGDRPTVNESWWVEKP